MRDEPAYGSPVPSPIRSGSKGEVAREGRREAHALITTYFRGDVRRE